MKPAETAPVSDVEYFIADPEDRDTEAGLRRLLRETAVPGDLTLSFEREPDFFGAARVEGEHHRTVVARDRATGRIVGMGSRCENPFWVRGELRHPGYLSQLRIAPEFRGRPAMLARGYECLRRPSEPAEHPSPEWFITTIIENNRTARRYLTSGKIPGAPKYRELGILSSFGIPFRSRRRPQVEIPKHWSVRKSTSADLPAIAEFIAEQYRSFRLAPRWSADDLGDSERCPGLRAEHFAIVLEQDRIRGCLALWDQQAFKQVMVCGYSGSLLWARNPLLRRGFNLLASRLGKPVLPPVDSPLPCAFLSHLAVDYRSDRPEGPDAAGRIFGLLLDFIERSYAERPFSILNTGLDSRHPLAEWIRTQLPHFEYRSVVCSAHWENGSGAVERELPASEDDRLFHLELACL